MKLYKEIILSLPALALMTSCADLATEPEGQLTGDLVAKAIEANPSLLIGSVKAINFSIAKEYCASGKDAGRADDFGWPSQCLSDAINAGDALTTPSGYDWFSVASSYQDRTETYANPYQRWAMFYKQIKAVNDLLEQVDLNTDNQKLQQYIGVAKTVRAFDYLQLVQMYAFTYKGHETSPAVPVFIAENEEGYDTLTSRRQTVEMVYGLIEKDLDDGEKYLAEYSRPDKSFVNLSVVYGLKARVALIKNEWSKAADYADKAIKAAAADGVTPASVDEMKAVGSMFNNVAEKNWMWGMTFSQANIETDGEYETWVSQISSLAAYSYTTEAGTYRKINSRLFNTINDTDVRKGWWVNNKAESPLIAGKEWSNSGVTAPLGKACGNLLDFEPYTNVKFGAAQGEIGSTHPYGDFPFMRVEEMYLIKAEAEGRQNEAAGVKTLEDFIKAYRDPSYEYAKKSTTNFIDEVWRQRRIELWCEGFAMGDILRLKKPMVRYCGNSDNVSNWDESYRFNFPAEDNILLMKIPQSEIDGNAYISSDDNNKAGSEAVNGLNPDLRDGVTD